MVYGGGTASDAIAQMNALFGGVLFIGIFLSIIFMMEQYSLSTINKSQKVMRIVNALSSYKKWAWIKNKSNKPLTSRS